MADNSIIINVQANTDNATQEIKKMANQTEDLGEKTKKTGVNWVELSAKISLAKEAFNTVKDVASAVFGKTKELVEGFEKVNNQLTILKSQKVWGDIKLQFDKLEEATGGVVDKFDLLESVNKATSFGIDLTGDKLLKLVAASSKAASMMGTDLKFAFDSLIVGTARESKMILDNLGVMVDVTKANEDYAKSIGKTVDSLTEEESKTALLTQVLDELGKSQSSIVDETLRAGGTGLFASLDRVWRDIKLNAGEFLSDFIQTIDESFMSFEERAKIHLTKALEDEKVRRKEAVTEVVQAVSDIENGITEKRKKDIESTQNIERDYFDTVEKNLEKRKIRTEAIAFVEKEMNANQHEDGSARITQYDEEQKKLWLINELRSKYGDVVAAEYELELSKGDNVTEILKKQSYAVGDTAANMAAWLKYSQDIKDFYDSWEDNISPNTRGEGAGIDEDAQKIANEKSAKWEEDFEKRRNKSSAAAAQKRYDDAIKQAELMKEYFGDGGLLDQIQTKQREEDVKDTQKAEEEKNQARKKSIEDFFKKSIEDKINRTRMRTNEIKEEMMIYEELKDMREQYLSKIAKIEQDYAEKELQDKEKYFNIVSGLMSDSINAIFDGSKENFLNALLGFADTFGTTLIMDGIKTMWMGTAKNSIFPGLGTSATAVGAAEIGIGTAMKAGAYIGGSFMSPSSTEGQSATEKNQGQNQNIVMNVTTSLYGSKKQAQKELNEVMR